MPQGDNARRLKRDRIPSSKLATPARDGSRPHPVQEARQGRIPNEKEVVKGETAIVAMKETREEALGRTKPPRAFVLLATKRHKIHETSLFWSFVPFCG